MKQAMKQDNRYYEVKKSKIHGSGAFAVRNIRAGTDLNHYGGELITMKEFIKRDEERTGSVFFFTIDKNTIIDGGVNGNSAIYINHSCDPNCDVEVDVKKKKVIIYTIKPIKIGEEITIDYQITEGRRATEEDYANYACKCGSPLCRGTMMWMSKKKVKEILKAKKK